MHRCDVGIGRGLPMSRGTGGGVLIRTIPTSEYSHIGILRRSSRSMYLSHNARIDIEFNENKIPNLRVQTSVVMRKGDSSSGLGGQAKLLNQEKNKLSENDRSRISLRKNTDRKFEVHDLVPEPLSLKSDELKHKQERPRRGASRFQKRDIKYNDFKENIQEREEVKMGHGSLSHYMTQVKTHHATLGGTLKPVSSAEFFSSLSFKDLGASEKMIQALRNQEIFRPSHIQAISYCHILNGTSCIIAEQSGSGKTLAYLSPLVQRLRDDEVHEKSKCLPKSPRVLILVPTSELAVQVLHACRTLSRAGIPFRSMAATGGFSQRTQLESLEESTDILIATPGRFSHLLEAGHLNLRNLRSIVLDEVDILFNDDKFSLILEQLIAGVPWETQYVFVTATLPLDVHKMILEKFPDCQPILGPSLHRTCSGLEEILVDCSGEQENKNPDTAFLNKKTALLELVEKHPVQKTIIFCNKIESCRKVENVLRRNDRKGIKSCIFPFHAAIKKEERARNLQQFLNMRSEKSSFLICTDRASRGLNLNNVEHVILFDYPRDPSEYVRRVGRTARAGTSGKAFLFVVGKQVSLAGHLLHRNQKGHPLHPLPSSLS
eukprot:TRINITY_DN25740_c0_g1_i1.p1 TRINITY_DN25740_c0_g1~~TRINITY_DN25740_c0_g1_i1.p1  ORF type:complete len:604 (+),score=98.03 TRINITY_DN25740_c0_g1_i1:156-1967(+)